jgi:hypothetical protein
MKKFVLIFLLIISLGLFACSNRQDNTARMDLNKAKRVNKESLNDETNETKSIIEENISKKEQINYESNFNNNIKTDAKVNLTFTQKYLEKENYTKLSIQGRFDNQVKCLIDEKDNEVKLINDLIHIKINRCQKAFNNHAFYEEFELENKDYKLYVTFDKTTDKYLLSIEESRILVKKESVSFTDVYLDEFKRKPENLLELKCHFNDQMQYDPQDNYCQKVFKSMEDIAETFLAGDNNEKISINQYYRYDGDSIELLNFMENAYRDNFYFLLQWKDLLIHCVNNACNERVGDYNSYLEIQYKEKPRTDINLCRIEDNEHKKNICIMEVAFYTKNEKHCELLEKDQGQCYSQVGMAKKDESLCNHSTATPNSKRTCLEFIEETKNEETTDQIGFKNVTINELIKNTEFEFVNSYFHPFDMPDFNIENFYKNNSEILEKISPFEDRKYQELKAKISNNIRYKNDAIIDEEKRKEGLYNLNLKIVGKLDGRKDEYNFDFYYDINNEKIHELISFYPKREALSNLLIKKVMEISQTNDTVSEFLEKYPNGSKSYKWFSNEDKELETYKNFFKSIEHGLTDFTDIVQVVLGSSKGQLFDINSSYKSISFYVNLKTEEVIFVKKDSSKIEGF